MVEIDAQKPQSQLGVKLTEKVIYNDLYVDDDDSVYSFPAAVALATTVVLTGLTIIFPDYYRVENVRRRKRWAINGTSEPSSFFDFLIKRV